MARLTLMNVCSRVYAGETLTRVYMNFRLSSEMLRGKTLDIGGGHSPNYFQYLKSADDVQRVSIDGSFDGIDFEKDALPAADASIDTLIACNVLEHIYNYRFLVAEMRRICSAQGQVIGFVPFWVGYHPDPHDYFRYTHESLRRIFIEAGFAHVLIEPLGGSPILANANTLILSLPRILRPAFYLWHAALNGLFLRLRPHSAERNPFGYFFRLEP